MNSLCAAFLVFLLMFISPTSSFALASVPVDESSQAVTATASHYSVRIQKSPYSLTLVYGGKQVLVTNSTKGRFIVRQGRSYQLATVKSWQQWANGLQVTVGTTLPGVDADVLLTFFDSHLQVQVKTTDALSNGEIGDCFLLESGGHWYGGNVTSAQNWPLETGSIVLDPFYSTSNQTSPIWLTSSGTALFVPTYQLMGFSLNKANDGLFSFHVKNSDQLTYQIAVGKNIVEAFYSMIGLVGKPRQAPPRDYFVEPIFNSWIEFHTDVTQKGLEEYVNEIKRNDFPCKIVEIDDKWSPTYGDFAFDPKKFPDPKGMIDKLHGMGLKVILWATPFFEKAAANYKIAESRRYLVMNESGALPYETEWWNGKAGLVDLSNPQAYSWYLGLLQGLQRQYGVDGYKLDGGDGEYLAKPFSSYGRISSLKYTDLFASLGQHFDINELRVSWLVQELGLLQRLRDKAPTWSREDGLNSLIPHGLTEGLIGYQFFCPDMIGGGLDSGFFAGDFKGMDQEMFVRWAEASTLMPMMQFSYAPWRMEEKHVAICRKYSKLHADLGDYIYSLALKATQDGTPIIRPLFFRNPEDEKTYSISNQFLLGDRFLVAPVLEKGATSRDVYLPQGTWLDFWSGQVLAGGQTLKSYPAPLEALPIFVSTQ